LSLSHSVSPFLCWVFSFIYMCIHCLGHFSPLPPPSPLPPATPSCVGYFQDMVSWTICLSWPPAMMLLISASQVTRITGVSHQGPFLSCSSGDWT
jgi:hypothetical protein